MAPPPSLPPDVSEVPPDRPPERWPDAAQPPPAGERHRRVVGGRAFVVGVVGLAVLLAVAAVLAFGERSTDGDGPYRPLDDSEFEARITGCSVFPDGRPNAAGTVANRTGSRRAMVVEIEVLDVEGVVIDTPRATVVSLAEDATTRWRVRSPYDVGRLTPLTCRVSDVFAAAPG